MDILLAHNDYGKFSGEEEAVETMAAVLEAHSHSVTWFRRSSAEIGRSLPRKLHALVSGIYSFESKMRMEQVLEKNKFDLVQAQNLYPFISPSILPVCIEKGVPVVMRCPNYRLFCPNGLHLSHGKVCERCLGGREWHCILQNCEDDILKSIGYAARNAFARSSGMIKDNVTVFIVLSEFQRKRFISGGIPSERIEILPNIAKIPDTANDDLRGKAVSYVGRISPEKGIKEFIVAARRLPQIQFPVAGSVEGWPAIRQGAPSNVEFRGFLSGDALDMFFRMSRIIVFPSICFEGFPNVIAKAMAHRKPVIASRIGVIPEIVDDGVTGLLFEPGNTSELAEKIEYLWNRQDLCEEMGEAGFRKAREEYSEARYYERLMDIYKKALAFARM